MVNLFKQLDQSTNKKKKNEILSKIQELFETVVKSNKDNYKDANFIDASYSIATNKYGATGLKNYANYATAYITDFTNKFQIANKENINKFKSFCLGKRSAVIVSMIAITGLLMSRIPKIYTKASGHINPNASAIYNEANKNKNPQNAQEKPDVAQKQADKKETKNKKNIFVGMFAGLLALGAAGAVIYKGKDSSPLLKAGYEKLNKLTKGMGDKTDKLFERIGKALDNEKAEKIIKPFEPTGANNSFLGLVALMFGTVIVPRVTTAAKRNPDNKEATKDEIKEILFRDLQTVLIILFALKSMNSVIGSKVTKFSGLPMTTKPYQPLFSGSMKGFKQKTQDFVSHPIEKLKIIKNNILQTLDPTGGVRALSNDEFTAKYSNYTFNDLPKLLARVEEEKGNKEKVFNKIVDGAISNCQKSLQNTTNEMNTSMDKNGKALSNLQKQLDNIKANIKALEELKEKGSNSIADVKDESVKAIITKYLQETNNSLVRTAKRLNAALRTVALGIEAGYLGFGLPALNQRRLEKKYLHNNQNDTFQAFSSDKSSASLISKNIKAYQIKLYHNFIK